MSKKGKHIGIGIIALIIILAFVFVLLPFNTTKEFSTDDYNYALDSYVELDGIPVMSQETGVTCFVVSMAIARNYFGTETTEAGLLNELNMSDTNVGILPAEYLPTINKAFDNMPYSVALINPKSQAEILNVVTESLTNELPVIFFYSAPDDWNKPKYNTHYGVIYGIDMNKQIVKISNPYGYLEDLSFTEFFEGLSFQSYKSEPLLFHLGRAFGYINPNNIFILENDRGARPR